MTLLNEATAADGIFYSLSTKQFGAVMEYTSDTDDTADHGETIWKRLLFMLLFVVIYSAAELVIFVVTVTQAGFIVFTGKRNPQLLTFGSSLAKFAYQMLQFFLFETNRKPFPFSDWPQISGER